MDMNENDSKTQHKDSARIYALSDTTECWNAIDKLLHLINCDLVNFSLFEKSRRESNSGINFQEPLFQRWAKYSQAESRDKVWPEVLINPKELIKNRSLEEICKMNSHNGGTNETFIYPLHDLGCIRIVFLDSRSTDNNALIRRKITIDQVFPHLTSCFSDWLTQRKRLVNLKQLTTREMEVIYWIKEGKSTWESAQILGITERTVKYHMKNILRKLDSSNRTQAVSKAIELGLINLTS
ncbi:MAG: helix-turn-helix transcriptional regulator [Candidatus Thiodiazotropha lotti]|nr:helix-turn-helix transcriptional regulator [Candidatus Thiodiazotropha lotti]